jgi:hypothetical protein
VIQVSDSDQQTMQLRALMDVRNSSDAWDLRCLVREKLIDFLEKNYPGSLPRRRGELEMQRPPRAMPLHRAGTGAMSASTTPREMSAPAIEKEIRRNA